jgi:MFS family permease
VLGPKSLLDVAKMAKHSSEEPRIALVPVAPVAAPSPADVPPGHEAVREDVPSTTNSRPMTSASFRKGGNPPTTTHEDPEILDPGYGARPACFSSTLDECLFVATATAALAATSVFTGSILTTTEPIGKSLNMTDAQLTWLWAANSLSSGAFLLLFGRAADLFGRRSMLICALAAYSVLCLIMGFVRNAVLMDVMSGLLGVSCAATVPPAIGKLGAAYERPSWRKNYAFACFSAGYPVGFVVGGFMAGVATQLSSWRVSFWAMSVLYAAVTIAAWWTVPADAAMRQGGSRRNIAELWREFDLLGALLTVAGVGSFTAAFTLSEAGWSKGYVISLLVVGVVLIGIFIWWQSVCRTPLMPLRVFLDKNFSLLLVITSLGNMSMSGNSFWISLMWQRIENQSPLLVAVRLLPAGIAGIIVTITSGAIMHRVSNKREQFGPHTSHGLANEDRDHDCCNTRYGNFQRTMECNWAIIFVLGPELHRTHTLRRGCGLRNDSVSRGEGRESNLQLTQAGPTCM